MYYEQHEKLCKTRTNLLQSSSGQTVVHSMSAATSNDYLITKLSKINRVQLNYRDIRKQVAPCSAQ